MKYRIIGKNYMQSSDNGKTWTVVREATKEDIANEAAKTTTPTTPVATPRAPAPKPVVKPRVGKTFPPYDSAEMRKYLTDNAFYDEHPELYNPEVADLQSANKQGGYGKQDYAGFNANNKDLMETFKKVNNRDYDKKNSSDVNWFQNAHRKQTISDAIAAGYSQAEAEALADKISFNPKNLKFDPRGIDSAHGDWTNSRVRFKFKPKAKTPDAPVTTPEAEQPTEEFDPHYTGGRREAPFWLQDSINTLGAVGNRLGLKKYLPWSPDVNLQAPHPTFYDPTRELAANAEQIAIGTQGAGTFSGPQDYNARFSQIAGAGAKNAANILSTYHNKNVGVANEFERLRSSIYNQNSQLNGAAAQKLYDGTTIANQQFDNSKRKANDEIRAQVVNALTNRAKTQTLNTLYPNYNVNPLDGGTTSMVHGTVPQPGTASNSGSDVEALKEDYGWTTQEAIDYLDGSSSKNRRGNRPYDDRFDFMNEYRNQQQGYTSNPNDALASRQLGGASPDFPTALRL